jgi:demethylmenaquinone methyltransferase / 2-methoxy-6-polyprenyl-1,4-benzoquinol methylase
VEIDKPRRIRDMFSSIAGRYDFLNHFLSANFDRLWRQACVQAVKERSAGGRHKILDIGCGTADLSLAFASLGPVIGCDFCRPMLQIAKDKLESSGSPPIFLLEADALTLPFRNSSFDIAVSAFVLRNLADVEQGLLEMRRILQPGGILGVLDFGMPDIPLFAGLYRFYFLRIVPKIGKMLSGIESPYGYLPASVQSFPAAGKLKQIAERSGFEKVECRLLTGGIAVLLTGQAA